MLTAWRQPGAKLWRKMDSKPVRSSSQLWVYLSHLYVRSIGVFRGALGGWWKGDWMHGIQFNCYFPTLMIGWAPTSAEKVIVWACRRPLVTTAIIARLVWCMEWVNEEFCVFLHDFHILWLTCRCLRSFSACFRCHRPPRRNEQRNHRTKSITQQCDHHGTFLSICIRFLCVTVERK